MTATTRTRAAAIALCVLMGLAAGCGAPPSETDVLAEQRDAHEPDEPERADEAADAAAADRHYAKDDQRYLDNLDGSPVPHEQEPGGGTAPQADCRAPSGGPC